MTRRKLRASRPDPSAGLDSPVNSSWTLVSGQDEAIASYLNELVEGTQRARNADEERTRDPETRMDSGGDDGTRTHDPLLAKQVL